MLRGLKFHFDNEYISEPVRYGPILLWQIGDIGCDPGYVVKDHRQYCYEITYVVGGRGKISSGGGISYAVEKGKLYLNRPDEIHRIESDTVEPIRYFYLGFDFEPKRQQNLWKDIKEEFYSCSCPLTVDVSDIRSVFSNAFNEMMTKDVISQERLSCLVQEIVMLCYRALSRQNPRMYVSNGSTVDQSQQLIYSIVNYIDTNVCAIEHLNDISRQVGYSYTYISRLFTQVMGKPMRDYYNEKRFEKAVSFLKAGMHSTEIASLLRYNSLHSFSKAFSNYFGISPSEYREKLKKEGELSGSSGK